MRPTLIFLISLLSLTGCQNQIQPIDEGVELFERVQNKVGSVLTFHSFTIYVPSSLKAGAEKTLTNRGYVVLSSEQTPILDDFAFISYRSSEPYKTGTYFVHKNKAISNCHVVSQGATYLEVDGTPVEATISEADIRRDICIVVPASKEHAFDAPSWPTRPFHSLNTGESVFLIGNPHGLTRSFSNGIVSSLRNLDDIKVIQVTAPSSPGSSGSPVFDRTAQLIGVLTAQVTDGQNLNFAISSDHIQNIKEESDKYLTFRQQAEESRTIIGAMMDMWPEEDRIGPMAADALHILETNPVYVESAPYALLKANILISQNNFQQAISLIHDSEASGLISIKDRFLIELRAYWRQWAHTKHDGPAHQYIRTAQAYRQLNPFDLKINANLASVLADLSRPGEALEVLRDSNAINPNETKTLQMHGHVHAGMENWETSMDYCIRAVQNDPDYLPAWACTGMAAQMLGNLEIQQWADDNISNLLNND